MRVRADEEHFAAILRNYYLIADSAGLVHIPVIEKSDAHRNRSKSANLGIRQAQVGLLDLVGFLDLVGTGLRFDTTPPHFPRPLGTGNVEQPTVLELNS